MKIRDKIVIAVFCLMLGVVIAVQYNNVQNNFLFGMLPNKRLQELSDDLEKLKKERDAKVKQLEELQARFDEITRSHVGNDAVIKDMTGQLEKFKKLAGFTDLQGSGVIITLDNDPSLENFASIDGEFQYLLLLVNELNAVGAEAISVNNQRIIAHSEIRNANNEIVINSTRQKSPFIVKAIGDSEVMYNSLSQRFGVVNMIRERGYLIELDKVDAVTIGKYNDVINFNFARSVSE